MPSGTKKRKAMRRKAEAANHHTLPGPSANCPNIQGNGAGGDNGDSSEHQLTKEEFSPRAAMEEPPHVPKPAVSDDPSLVPVEQGTFAESEPPEAVVETEPPPEAVLETEQPPEAVLETEPPPKAVVETEPPPEAVVETELPPEAVVETELPPEAVVETEPPPVAVAEALAITESPAPLQVEETSGKAFLQVQRSEIPVSTFRVEDTSDEAGGLESEETEIPVSSSRDVPLQESARPPERASWWNCCGLLGVFGGSQRRYQPGSLSCT